MLEVIPSRYWKNRETGATFPFPQGIAPFWKKDGGNQEDWEIIRDGWKVKDRNDKSFFSPTFVERSEALAWISSHLVLNNEGLKGLWEIFQTKRTIEVRVEGSLGSSMTIEQEGARYRFTWHNGKWSDWFILSLRFHPGEQYSSCDLYTIQSMDEYDEQSVSVYRYREDTRWTGNGPLSIHHEDPIVALAHMRWALGEEL